MVIKKEMIFGGFLAILIVLWSAFIMSLFTALIESKEIIVEGKPIEEFNLGGIMLAVIAAIAIATILGHLTRKQIDKWRGKSGKPKVKSRIFEITNKAELFMGTGMGLGGLLAISTAFPVESIAITNIFWLWIGFLPLLLALANTRKTLLENKLSFAISYIITFAISVLIVSNFFNLFVKIWLALNF